MGAQNKLDAASGWSAKEGTEFLNGADSECCYDPGFKSGSNQTIDDLFGVPTGKGTFLDGIKLVIMIIDKIVMLKQ